MTELPMNEPLEKGLSYQSCRRWIRAACLTLCAAFVPLLAADMTSAEEASSVDSGDPANQTPHLSPQLEAFRPFLGKTYRGEFKMSGKAAVDVSNWEAALDGHAIRILHSLNEGEYRGETMIVWNANEEALKFYYFTNAGFYTIGTATFDGNSFVSREIVTGNADGITSVVAKATLTPGEGMSVESTYYRGEEVVSTSSVEYLIVSARY